MGDTSVDPVERVPTAMDGFRIPVHECRVLESLNSKTLCGQIKFHSKPRSGLLN